MTPAALVPEFSQTPTRAAQDQPVVIRIWVPMILVWIVLSPFLILLSPLLVLGLAMAGLNPFRALAAAFGLLAALGGVQVDVDTPEALVNIHLI